MLVSNRLKKEPLLWPWFVCVTHRYLDIPMLQAKTFSRRKSQSQSSSHSFVMFVFEHPSLGTFNKPFFYLPMMLEFVKVEIPTAVVEVMQIY